VHAVHLKGLFMNRRIVLALMAVMALGLISQTAAEAGGGGGGSKKNATVKVYNSQTGGGAVTEGVLFLASGKAVPTTQAAFTAAGGKPVSPSTTPVTFPVPAGKGTMIVADALPPTGSVDQFYNFSAGKTYIYVIGGDINTPTITPSTK